MKKYEIKYYSYEVITYEIEAKSEEEAEKKVDEAIMQGTIDPVNTQTQGFERMQTEEIIK